ncbi:hypothetical protein CDAR_569271 [Caerostris darwini]|uniref:Ycf15 n=1 Tax=Caerostris darwini TaxID=1538125 RepID=A0AAV4NT13_9ARAC|nr:hypothetical protein CDAR_569271 [Caerostris darwini]
MSQRMSRDVPSRKKKAHYPLIVCFQFWFTTPLGDESVIAYNTSRHEDGNGEGVVPEKWMRSDLRLSLSRFCNNSARPDVVWQNYNRIGIWYLSERT